MCCVLRRPVHPPYRLEGRPRGSNDLPQSIEFQQFLAMLSGCVRLRGALEPQRAGGISVSKTVVPEST
jgi:hypothetical protein